MKKVYIIPSCEVHAVSVQSLCMSLRVSDTETEGTNGAWSKGLNADLFGGSESSDNE